MNQMIKNLNFKCLLGLFLGAVLSGSSYAAELTKSQLVTESLVLEGVFAQGGMLRGKLSQFAEVSLNDKPIRVTSNGEFILGFGRDADRNQRLLLTKGSKQERIDIKIFQRSYQTQSIEGVPQQTVTPSKDKLNRIRKETAQVKSARKTDSDLEYYKQTFVAPINGPITGVYGSQRIYNGVPKRPHFGVDYAGPVGASVYAPASGVVTLVHKDMYYSGGTLIVDHGYGMSSTFIHLSEILVEEGDQIRQGDEIAKVGAGGRSTGPHLDWRVNWYDTRLDPQLVLLLSE